MKRIADWIRGYIVVRVAGASPQLFLNEFAKQGIPFWNTRFRDELTVICTIRRSDAPCVRRIAEKTFCTVERMEEHGAEHRYGGLRKRLVLLLTLTAAVAAAVIVPKFVWFYSVEGNQTIPTEKILRMLPEAGVHIGMYGPNIIPQHVKDRMLLLMPELEWLTVTQCGGCARVIVRERTQKGKIIERGIPRDLRASRAGMITEVSALDGAPMVKPGDVVTEDQILVSGYMDLEYKVRACTAAGEVYARTWREETAVLPVCRSAKLQDTAHHTAWYLCIGRKRIKIFGNSSNFSTECDKMTTVKPVALPGGHTLPISFVRETTYSYETSAVLQDEAAVEEALRNAVLQRTQSDMVAGKVLNAQWDFGTDGQVYAVRGMLECEEMIARPKNAELIEDDQYDDGTSHQRGADRAVD